ADALGACRVCPVANIAGVGHVRRVHVPDANRVAIANEWMACALAGRQTQWRFPYGHVVGIDCGAMRGRAVGGRVAVYFAEWRPCAGWSGAVRAGMGTRLAVIGGWGVFGRAAATRR